MAEPQTFTDPNSAPPPPYAPPPYPGPGDGSALPPQYPPPGQGYGWQQAPAPGYPDPQHAQPVGTTGPGDPAKQGYPAQPGYAGPGYPTQPVHSTQPGYQGQPGYPGYPGPGQPGYQGQPGYPAYAGGYQQGPYTTQQHQVTVVQGGPNVIIAPQIAPPDYSGLAWFACLFCFWPVGLCAIIKSNETRQAINRGDIVSANQFSLETRKYANYAICIQITIIVVIVVMRLALIAVY